MTGRTRESSAGQAKPIHDGLTAVFGARCRPDVSLAPMTTFKVGGSADWFLDSSDPHDVVRAVVTARRLGLPITVLGGGSNILVGSGGVRGLVVRMWHGEVSVVGPGVVRADAGVSLNGLVRWTINRGLAGLERWAGTPGTVGGALHGNAHFQGNLIGDRVLTVGLVDSDGATRRVDAAEMEFGYDSSRLQRTREASLWAEFSVSEADPKTLRAAARESLGYRKMTQPLAARSAGCIFRNPDPAIDLIPEGVPASAGALIEGAGLKERSVGRARVSALHGNFVVSDGTASPGEIRTLIETCRAGVHAQFGVTLRDEIVCMGEF
jgi:UDP-N-acetylmuramate dehydrogenase